MKCFPTIYKPVNGVNDLFNDIFHLQRRPVSAATYALMKQGMETRRCESGGFILIWCTVCFQFCATLFVIFIVCCWRCYCCCCVPSLPSYPNTSPSSPPIPLLTSPSFQLPFFLENSNLAFLFSLRGDLTLHYSPANDQGKNSYNS